MKYLNGINFREDLILRIKDFKEFREDLFSQIRPELKLI